ncbi:MAG: hypothetical protein KKB20_19810 [Proteobacteria bacterium]|nr:hypothetical protein [Pseudomonadota bacterium]
MTIYRLADGDTVDTERELDFEQRNFIQKMMIHAHLDVSLEAFRARWRVPGNPVWNGTARLSCPSPAVRILLDLEEKVRKKKALSQV